MFYFFCIFADYFRNRGGLEPVLGILIPPLAANLASSKQDVRTLTIEVFDLLVSHVDNTVLIPYFTLAAANHANVKVKVAILQHLADIVGAVYQYKSQVVVKHVLPFAFKLLDERKVWLSIIVNCAQLGLTPFATLRSVQYGSTGYFFKTTTAFIHHCA